MKKSDGLFGDASAIEEELTRSDKLAKNTPKKLGVQSSVSISPHLAFIPLKLKNELDKCSSIKLDDKEKMKKRYHDVYKKYNNSAVKKLYKTLRRSLKETDDFDSNLKFKDYLEVLTYHERSAYLKIQGKNHPLTVKPNQNIDELFIQVFNFLSYKKNAQEMRGYLHAVSDFMAFGGKKFNKKEIDDLTLVMHSFDVLEKNATFLMEQNAAEIFKLTDKYDFTIECHTGITRERLGIAPLSGNSASSVESLSQLLANQSFMTNSLNEQQSANTKAVLEKSEEFNFKT